MRKVLVILSLLLVFSSIVFAEDYDFRNVNWGMSMEQVKSIEKNAILLREDEMALNYATTLLDRNTLLIYRFINDKLNIGFYSFVIQHTNDNLYIDDYNEIKKTLIEKYKEPAIDKTIWNNDLYKDDPNYYGLAVSLGYLTYASVWETNKTEISLMLSGDNYKISLGLLYKSKDIKEEKKDNFGL